MKNKQEYLEKSQSPKKEKGNDDEFEMHFLKKHFILPHIQNL